MNHDAAPEAGAFRVRLMVAMMVSVVLVASVTLYFAQRHLTLTVERGEAQRFRGMLDGLRSRQELRHAILMEFCRMLSRRPRIHAALEDDALDLLYPAAGDELKSLMTMGLRDTSDQALHGLFYRFIDERGRIIPPPGSVDAGGLSEEEMEQFKLPELPVRPEVGYIFRGRGEDIRGVVEVLITPILSMETQEPIAGLVIGFDHSEGIRTPVDVNIMSGVWLGGRIYFPGLPVSRQLGLAHGLCGQLGQPSDVGRKVVLAGVPYLMLHTPLDTGPGFPSACEIRLSSLKELEERQSHLRLRILALAGLVLCCGLVGSHVVSRRLSRPVEQLALDLEQDRIRRVSAEAALELSNEGLQRSIRFSADASHQLKTPVTVLRAGLEELLAGKRLTNEVREEIGELIHQTYRLSNVIDDLLLLSRVDSGRLQLRFGVVDLTRLLEVALDDLGAFPASEELEVEVSLERGLRIAGEARYVGIVVQNLFENARKYNVKGGFIGVRAVSEEGWAVLRVRNSGRPIPLEFQAHIFERFNRGVNGEEVPGHGLGLNLARELARLQGGQLRLVCSDTEGTEFEARFPLDLSGSGEGASEG